MLRTIIDFGTVSLFGREISLRLYGYGLMLVLGFLAALGLARWRARRAGENPEQVVQYGIVALVSGVLGARIAYVIQHWRGQFAGQGPMAVLNLTSGGLIYYGGVILATACVLVYFRIMRLPIRRHVDIVAASLMVGLAFGRMGCLMNGCCYGGLCRANWTFGTRFPMHSRPLVKLDGRDNPFSQGSDAPSPAYQHQANVGAVALDDRLANHRVQELVIGQDPDDPQRLTRHVNPPLPPYELHGKLDTDQLHVLDVDPAAARKGFDALAGPDGLIDRGEWQAGVREPKIAAGLLAGSEQWAEAITFDRLRDGRLDFAEVRKYLQWRKSWLVRRFDTSGEDGRKDERLSGAERQRANEFLQADQIALARQAHALPVKPAQILGIVNALLLAGLLTLFHRVRSREGQVFALLLVMYPITRFMLEAIRDDNPHDLLRAGLAHNQYTSLAMMIGGVILLAILRKLPASAGPTYAERLGLKPAPAAQRK